MPRQPRIRQSAAIASDAVDQAADDIRKTSTAIRELVELVRCYGIEIGLKKQDSDVLVEKFCLSIRVGQSE